MYSLKRLVRLFALSASWVVPAGAVQAPRYLDTQLSQYIRNEPAAVPAVLHTYTFGLIDLTKLNPFLGSTDLVNLVSGATCDTATNDSICRDRPGLGSGLEFAPESQVFFSHTDRGPNQDCKDYFPATKQTGVNFPVPRFSPSFVSFKLENGRVRMLTTNHLRKTNGDPVSGRSNTSNDEKNFVNKCTGEIGESRDGIDWEDMRRFPDGVHFMGSEEYSPSVFIFDATGRILKRYVPIGQTLVRTETAGYPVKELLPPVVARRRPNRGFENLALTKDGSRAYAVLQSPMGNATLPEFAKNRMIRVVELDVSQPTKAKYIGMYAFLMSDPAEYKRQKTSYKDVRLGSAAHLTKKTLLILEQGNGGKKLYTVDLSKASNLKGRFDDSLKPESAASDLRRMQVELGTVKIVLDTDAMPVIDSDLFAKQEGLTVLAPSTVAMITDNDFGLENGKPTQIRFLHLTSKLPGIQNVFAASTDHSGPRKPQCNYRHCVGDKCYTVLGKASHSSASAACRIMGAVLIDQKFAKTLQTSSRLKELLSETLDWAWEEDEDSDEEVDDKGYAWLACSQSDQGDMCPVAVHKHGSSKVRTEWKRCAAGSEYASLCEVARPSECK